MGHPESQERLFAIVDMLRETRLLEEVVRIEPRDATKEEITLVHDPKYFDLIQSTKGKIRVFLDPDTSTCPVSFNAAVRAVGGMLDATDKVMKGEVDIAFPLVRPPGHHAERHRAMGFCLFNNVNGSQNIFYDSSEVFYFSTHQYPYYPGTGSFNEVGVQNGLDIQSMFR